MRAKLHEELDRELGDAIPTLDTLKRLPYTLRAVSYTHLTLPTSDLV